MRVETNHVAQQVGWILKTTYYAVELRVFFTHEERQIIQVRGLSDTKLLDRRPANARVDDRDEKFELRVRDLLDGKTDRFLCRTPSGAKIYEEQLLSALAQMKLWLDDNAEIGAPRVVEF